MVEARATGTTAIFNNPFAIVEFWARTTGAGVWRRIDRCRRQQQRWSTMAPERRWTYTTTWNPDASTAPFTTPR
jgi:hypothetical protein